MGNCLVTKLKGVVDNPNLPKFGEGFITFWVSKVGPKFGLKQNVATTFKILSDSPDDVFRAGSSDPTELGKEVTFSYGPNLYFKDAAARNIKLSIISKYNIDMVSAIGLLAEGTTLEEIASAFVTTTDFRLDNNHGRLTGNLSALSGRNDITYLGIGNTGIVGNTDDVASMVNMQIMGFPQGVGGSLENLKGMTKLILLYLNDSTVGNGESINDLFDYWASLGKEGNLDFNLNSVVIASNDSAGNPPANGNVVFENNSWHWPVA